MIVSMRAGVICRSFWVVMVVLSILAIGCAPSLRRQTRSQGIMQIVLEANESKGTMPPTILFGDYSVPNDFLLGTYLGREPEEVLNLLVKAKPGKVVLVRHGANMGDLSELLRSSGFGVYEFDDLPTSGVSGAVRGRGRHLFETAFVLSGTLKYPDRFFVGFYIGRDVKKAAEVIQQLQIRRVAFESGVKMAPETARAYLAVFDKAAVALSKFEVPRSTGRSGWLDYISQEETSE